MRWWIKRLKPYSIFKEEKVINIIKYIYTYSIKLNCMNET